LLAGDCSPPGMKSEAPSPKSETNPKHEQGADVFHASNFEFVSDFEIRISDFMLWFRLSRARSVGVESLANFLEKKSPPRE
jgi:hypothetical protein